METVDERSLMVLTTWSNRKYKNEGQKAADLQCLIISALKEQHRLTRRHCIQAVAGDEADDKDDVILGNAIRRVAILKAV